MPMDQLTVRGFEPEVERRLRELARREGISLSQAAMRLIRRGVGIDPLPVGTDQVGGALDHLIGTLPAEDAAALDEALAPTRVVDDELWT